MHINYYYDYSRTETSTKEEWSDRLLLAEYKYSGFAWWLSML